MMSVESDENSGIDSLNCAVLPKLGVSVMFKRFLLHNWHIFCVANFFNFVLKMCWLSMLIIRYVIIQIYMETTFKTIIG